MNSKPAKCFSLSAATEFWSAWVVAAMILSKPLRGRTIFVSEPFSLAGSGRFRHQRDKLHGQTSIAGHPSRETSLGKTRPTSKQQGEDAF
jgi:hypothetical protein